MIKEAIMKLMSVTASATGSELQPNHCSALWESAQLLATRRVGSHYDERFLSHPASDVPVGVLASESSWCSRDDAQLPHTYLLLPLAS